MKSFKQFLVENETNNVEPIESDVQMTDFNLPQQKLQNQPTKQDNKNVSPEDENFPEEVEKENTGVPETEEQWREQNEEPKLEDFDSDGDGKLDEEELEEYRRAYQNWLFDLELWRHDQKEPNIEDFDGRIGEYREAYEKWRRERERIFHRFDPDEFPDNPSDTPNPGKLPSGVDYEYWWNLWKQIYGRNGDMQHFYDWVWRMMRGETPGFEHIPKPYKGEYPIP